MVINKNIKKWFKNLKGKTMETIEIPCQNCGKKIEIITPFVGCPFCEECMNNQVMWTSGTENFDYNEG